MKEIVDKLKPFALMAVNKLKTELPPEYINEIDMAYARAINYDSLICPNCWVIKHKDIRLNIAATSSGCNIYKCSECDFEEAIAK